MLTPKSFILKESDVKLTSLPLIDGDYRCYLDPFYSGLGDPMCDCLPLVDRYDYDQGKAVRLRARIPSHLAREISE